MLHAFLYNGEEHLDPPSLFPLKKWNQSTGVLISVVLLIWFKSINKYPNHTLLLSLPLKEEDIIPTLKKELNKFEITFSHPAHWASYTQMASIKQIVS